MADHYFTEKPTSDITTEEFEISVRGTRLFFTTPSGVFSYGRADKASSLLVECAEVPEKAKVLDFGCAWGFIGIAIKKSIPSVDMTMIDVNERALKFAERNARRNRVDVKIIKSDLFQSVKGKFDEIIVNPPMKAGREICYKIIEDSVKYLEKNGTLQLVALHNRGGAMLEKKMNDVFGNVETIAKKSGFRVYLSRLQI